MGLLRYSANNSGGSFWLTTENWQALEKAGWVVHWIHNIDDGDHTHQEEHSKSWGFHDHSYLDSLVPAVWSGEDWLGTPAKSAIKVTDNPDSDITEFESLTGMNADSIGCTCCGPPHSFSFEDDNGSVQYLDSQPVDYERNWW